MALEADRMELYRWRLVALWIVVLPTMVPMTWVAAVAIGLPSGSIPGLVIMIVETLRWMLMLVQVAVAWAVLINCISIHPLVDERQGMIDEGLEGDAGKGTDTLRRGDRVGLNYGDDGDYSTDSGNCEMEWEEEKEEEEEEEEEEEKEGKEPCIEDPSIGTKSWRRHRVPYRSLGHGV